MTKQELINEMEGAEFRSLEYEDIVYIQDGTLFGAHRGEIKSTNSMSKQDVSDLFDEMFYDEFGTTNVNDLI